ncbi:hypothetical protein JX265_003636 [Neoarthrinium moseri]|uniref:Ankyrin repeat protein n=1 Tax=Neoarthrinium moseri TaxID=1658444 RepID=A0A9P9WSG7_9PEZI|nr:hypothetical protein JX266_001181 [Neoarthrinium moseri]KAI1877628.1 hypothetical protein JX265_003636 [Neoarthrinium moseri]
MLDGFDACRKPSSLPLFGAVIHGRWDALELLIAYGADLGISPHRSTICLQRDSLQMGGVRCASVLDIAISNNRVESVQRLLLMDEVEVSPTNLYTACEANLSEMVHLIIRSGRLGAHGLQGILNYALFIHAGSNYGTAGTVDALIEYGADPTVPHGRWADTACEHAVRHENSVTAARLVIRAGDKLSLELKTKLLHRSVLLDALLDVSKAIIAALPPEKDGILCEALRLALTATRPAWRYFDYRMMPEQMPIATIKYLIEVGVSMDAAAMAKVILVKSERSFWDFWRYDILTIAEIELDINGTRNIEGSEKSLLEVALESALNPSVQGLVIECYYPELLLRRGARLPRNSERIFGLFQQWMRNSSFSSFEWTQIVAVNSFFAKTPSLRDDDMYTCWAGVDKN